MTEETSENREMAKPDADKADGYAVIYDALTPMELQERLMPIIVEGRPEERSAHVEKLSELKGAAIALERRLTAEPVHIVQQQFHGLLANFGEAYGHLLENEEWFEAVELLGPLYKTVMGIAQSD